MSEPPQAGRHTLREIAASLWEDGLGDVILAIANGDVVAIGSEEMTNATIADRDDATGFLCRWTRGRLLQHRRCRRHRIRIRHLAQRGTGPVSGILTFATW